MRLKCTLEQRDCSQRRTNFKEELCAQGWGSDLVEEGLAQSRDGTNIFSAAWEELGPESLGKRKNTLRCR